MSRDESVRMQILSLKQNLFSFHIQQMIHLPCQSHVHTLLMFCPMIWNLYRLVVSTHLKNISQIGSFPQVGMKINNSLNQHLVYFVPGLWLQSCWWPLHLRTLFWVKIQGSTVALEKIRPAEKPNLGVRIHLGKLTFWTQKWRFGRWFPFSIFRFHIWFHANFQGCIPGWSKMIQSLLIILNGNKFLKKRDAFTMSIPWRKLLGIPTLLKFQGNNWNNVGNKYSWNLEFDWLLFWWDDGMTFRFRVTSYTSSVTGVLGKSDNTSIPGPYIYIIYMHEHVHTIIWVLWGMYDRHLLHMFTPYSIGCNDKFHEARKIQNQVVTVVTLTFGIEPKRWASKSLSLITHLCLYLYIWFLNV